MELEHVSLIDCYLRSGAQSGASLEYLLEGKILVHVIINLVKKNLTLNLFHFVKKANLQQKKLIGLLVSMNDVGSHRPCV